MPVLFWRPYEAHGWLSNWSPHAVRENGVQFQTVEHYLMYGKAVEMRDDECASRILAAPTPAEAKRLGRAVQNWDEAAWIRARERIILRGLRLKTEQHPQIRRDLLATGDDVIAEASPFDAVWGIGLARADAMEGNWPGLNLLGEAWMRVRSELRG